ncbi:hypothetical protein A3709_20615 [Halioglobus sp. HI00S01]|uniref:DUF805 domain-containing protein n=1 Tax=Halioglobus sp. HI00S01 TaxID=1822214 RepID=UPI0007C205AB|nr:hypothetical protein A3709_20615 [Halioglobus sp. HI00S01]
MFLRALALFFQPAARVFDVRGRSTRREAWIYLLAWTPACLLALDLFVEFARSAYGVYGRGGITIVFWAGIHLAPGIALFVRRLHDIGRSGGWLLLSLIPGFGLFLIAPLLVIPSASLENEYGPSGKDNEGRMGNGGDGFGLIQAER